METNYNFKTYEELESFVHEWHVEHYGENYGWGDNSNYREVLCNVLNFYPDGYDQYGARCYSNGILRVAVFYNHGERYWQMEPAQGSSETSYNFYNTTNDVPDIYGYY